METTSEAVRPLFDEDALGESADVVLQHHGVCTCGEIGEAHRRTPDIPAIHRDGRAERIGSHQELAGRFSRSRSELEVLRNLPPGRQRDRNAAPLGGGSELDDVLAHGQFDAERRHAMRRPVHEHGYARG